MQLTVGAGGVGTGGAKPLYSPLPTHIRQRKANAVEYEVMTEDPTLLPNPGGRRATCEWEKYLPAFDKARETPGEWVVFTPDVSNCDTLAWNIRRGQRAGAKAGEFEVKSRKGRIHIRKPLAGETIAPPPRRVAGNQSWGKYEELFDATRAAAGEWVGSTPNVASVYQLAAQIRRGGPRGCSPGEFEVITRGNRLFLRLNIDE